MLGNYNDLDNLANSDKLARVSSWLKAGAGLVIEETEHQWECQKAACFILRTGYLGQDSWENEKKIAYALQPTRQLGLSKAQRPPRA